MARFIAGAVAAMLLLTGGLLWWQGRADSASVPQPQAACRYGRGTPRGMRMRSAKLAHAAEAAAGPGSPALRPL